MRAKNIITKARSRLWWSGGETRRSVETIKDGYDYVFVDVNFSTRTANVGLNKIQFRTTFFVEAGSRMLKNIYRLIGEW